MDTDTDLAQPTAYLAAATSCTYTAWHAAVVSYLLVYGGQDRATLVATANLGDEGEAPIRDAVADLLRGRLLVEDEDKVRLVDARALDLCLYGLDEDEDGAVPERRA